MTGARRFDRLAWALFAILIIGMAALGFTS